MRAEHGTSIRGMERLSRMRGYDVASREPDPRGWTVVNRDGRAVGKVRDLIVDTDRMTATYLDVELDTKLFDFHDDDPHILVPVARAQREGRHVIVDDVGPGWVSDLCAARDLHQREFWERWWRTGPPHGEQSRAAGGPDRLHPDELNRVIDGLRPGESVRIPVAQEEIVVERRPIQRPEPVREEVVVNRAADEPPERRR